MVKSPEGSEPWKNVEMTGYFRVIKTYGSPPSTNTSATEVNEADYALQAYARGGIHSNQLMKGSDGEERYLNCVGSGYKGKFYFGGDASVAKEIGHPVYAPERFRQEQQPSEGNATSVGWTRIGKGQFEPLVSDFTVNDDPGQTQPSRWIGMKVVLYDYMEDNEEYARILTYIDDNADDGSGRLIPSNEWRLLSDVVDKGDWIADPRPRAAPLGAAVDNATTALDTLITKCGNPFSTKEEYSRMVISWLGHPDFINDPAYRALANSASFRWDYSGAEFAYLSVREIGGVR
jgi:hypothetical protein